MVDTAVHSGDPWSWMTGLGYSHIASYFTQGQRFTHRNISLQLYRLLVTTKDPAKRSDIDSFKESETKLLDQSGNYLLQASIRVQDGSKVEIVTKAVNELWALRETLKGVVELAVVDRLALDPRVR